MLALLTNVDGLRGNLIQTLFFVRVMCPIDLNDEVLRRANMLWRSLCDAFGADAFTFEVCNLYHQSERINLDLMFSAIDMCCAAGAPKGAVTPFPVGLAKEYDDPTAVVYPGTP